MSYDIRHAFLADKIYSDGSSAHSAGLNHGAPNKTTKE